MRGKKGFERMILYQEDNSREQEIHSFSFWQEMEPMYDAPK